VARLRGRTDTGGYLTVATPPTDAAPPEATPPTGATAVVDGTWDLVIETPIGTQRATVELSTADGVLRGVARDPRHGDRVPLADLALTGNRLIWAQSITRPLRLNLRFELVVEGDRLTGRSKAGRLPASTVTGQRVGPAPTGNA
jgi:hypothetical protein